MTGNKETEDEISALATRRPGDDEFSYDDVDVKTLPEWWQEAIAEHEAFGLRPYRPPRFADDVITRRVVEAIEDEERVEIRLRGKDVTVGDPWTVLVDESVAFEVPRRRDPSGYTVFEIDSDEFRDRVERYLQADR
jgi:hypothetical protein